MCRVVVAQVVVAQVMVGGVIGGGGEMAEVRAERGKNVHRA